MILIEDAKYSCIECIRGHRSSLCRHHTRPLLQVRSKGRPNVHANGNPNHRIAVFAEEIANDTFNNKLLDKENGNSRKSSKGTCKNRNSPVIILKTSPKQVIDLTNGEIVGLYEEKTVINDKDKPPVPIINGSSFINSSPCCSNGVKKPNKSCGCSVNKSKNIGKSKILKTYLKNHLKEKKDDNEWKFIDFSKDLKVKIEPDVSNLNDENSLTNLEGKIFDVVSVPSCSIPGSCCCNDDCSCEGCEVHNANGVSNTRNSSTIDPDINNSNTLQKENLVFNTIEAGLMQVPNIINNPILQNSSIYPTNTYLNTSNETSLESFANIFYDNNYIDEDSPSTSNTCLCPENSCDCSNCETHGRINGMKLDDLFQSNFDPKLFSLLIDDTNEAPSWSGPRTQNSSIANGTKSLGCCGK